MGRKLPITPVSQIKGCFRILTMRCREAHAVRKRDNNTCTIPGCGKKQSVAKGREVKIQVHHTKAPNWARICQVVREELLDPAHMVCICKECHDREHDKDGSGWEGHKGKKKTEQEKEDGSETKQSDE